MLGLNVVYVKLGFIPIYNYEKENVIIGSDLHGWLNIQTRLSNWIPRMTEQYIEIWIDKNENVVDYLGSPQRMSRRGYSKEYIITLDIAKDICRKQNNNKEAGDMLNYLLSFDNKEVMIIEPIRKEIEFGEMLDKITGFTWQKQFPIDGGKYRLDFYLDNTLIVEYDEAHHKYQKEKDDIRIKYCRDWLAEYNYDGSDWRCPVIRVKEGEELEGLNRIIIHLAQVDMFDSKDVCDLECYDK